MTEIDERRGIPDYENYQVSNNGQVKNVQSDKILKLSKGTNKAGYYLIALCKNGRRKSFHIQQVVAKVFLDNPDKKLTVEHIDKDAANNNVSNLRWV